MTKLINHGYTERTSKTYQMTLGELILTVCHELCSMNMASIEIRMVNTTEGEIDRWDGVAGLMQATYNTYWNVILTKLQIRTDCTTGESYAVVTFETED